MGLVSAAQRQQFRDEGYFILESVIPQDHLDLLRGACQTFVDRMNERMDAEGTDVIGINHRHKRYFVANEPILSPDGSKLWGNAEPFLRNGDWVADEPPPDLSSRLE